jgi:hypothetical protein
MPAAFGSLKPPPQFPDLAVNSCWRVRIPLQLFLLPSALSRFCLRSMVQMRDHCKDKSNSRESFVPNSEVEVVDIEPKVTKLKLRTQNSELRTYYESAIDFGLQQDPLFDLELLQRISDRHYGNSNSS